ncbi:tryptophan 2,3-dioxygenase [Rhodococcus rhodnii]|uniref:Tryptophan 2,3-dioxygenase n=2 Tax=Rhodococcus rhodnii TaxID=38312 RepID=R7WRK8_9NOCA|nr:tryptophan 2,3-dioxygenase family protein [Rhodococcus rhodnii]EOM76609.1 tryptophan 2,3-dioxygenase [Rhodococcus rhodnii LMG 5362]TXG89489.1 tryptophan 2,3-dioxygenase [Rhodococcus rhodnii]
MTSVLSIDPHVRTEIEEWYERYLQQPHDDLGRSGPVCPFVGPSTAAGAMRFEQLELGEDVSVTDIATAMERQLERFPTLQWPEGKDGVAALVTVVDLPPSRLPLLDEAQRITKTTAVERGLMLGQFHPECPEPAERNPEFEVSLSPVPLFVVRNMALHDILFLHSDPTCFRHYDERFGDRYTGTSVGKVDDRYTALYENAMRTTAATGSEYIDYQSIDVLLSLQNPHTRQPAEMTFYLAGQAKELMFKMVYELGRHVRLALVQDESDAACSLLFRASRAMRWLEGAWDVLATLSPMEFESFRPSLGNASGIDSYMYRMVEFSLGNKSTRMLARYDGLSGVSEQVHRAFNESSIYDEAIAHLTRQGWMTGAGPAEVQLGWRTIYSRCGPDTKEFRLAEALMEFAYAFARWRAVHLLVVERTIGWKPGTGGTEGVDWLRRVAEHRIFPELWSARDSLGASSVNRSPQCPFA